MGTRSLRRDYRLAVRKIAAFSGRTKWAQSSEQDQDAGWDALRGGTQEDVGWDDLEGSSQEDVSWDDLRGAPVQDPVEPASPVSDERSLGGLDSRTQRNLTTLRPDLRGLAAEHIRRLRQEGIDARIVSGSRSIAHQQRLKNKQQAMSPAAQKDYPVATPGNSAHNYGAAYDIGIFVDGKYDGRGSNPGYQRAGEIGRGLGLDWGARFNDLPHYQLPSWKTLTLSPYRPGSRMV